MYHFIGIKGTGMAALASMLHGLGESVEGSDLEKHFFTEDELLKQGIKIMPFDEKNIDSKYIIVKGNAFNEDNPEVRRALELGNKIYTYQDMVSKLSSMGKTIGVSGTHGKTTTTTMLKDVLFKTLGANYLIGDGSGYAKAYNELFLLESCEWKRHFLAFFPYYSVITNIDLDHMDYYQDIDDIIDAFESFANKTKECVFACGDDENVRKMNVRKPILYYGFNDINNICAMNINFSELGTSFDFIINKELKYRFNNLPLYGNHQILNSLPVIMISNILGLDFETIERELGSFKGAKRRFEVKDFGSIITVADYAHHPSEIKATIDTARKRYPDKKVIAVHLIHTKSRAKILENEFADALNQADVSYLMDIYTDREERLYENVTHEAILSKLNNGHYIKNDASSVPLLLDYDDAVILFMSSKEIYVLQNAYEEELKLRLKR